MSYDEVADKFRECARFAGIDGERVEPVVDAVARLEELDSVRALTEPLTRER